MTKYVTINGEKIPVVKWEAETTITNIKTGKIYKNEENEDIVERGPVSYFQLMGVTQTVDPSGWKTELKTRMRINKLPAEGILKYKVPKTDYVAGDDNVSNVKRIPPPPPRPGNDGGIFIPSTASIACLRIVAK
mgnify:CR=1 FL=1